MTGQPLGLLRDMIICLMMSFCFHFEPFVLLKHRSLYVFGTFFHSELIYCREFETQKLPSISNLLFVSDGNPTRMEKWWSSPVAIHIPCTNLGCRWLQKLYISELFYSYRIPFIEFYSNIMIHRREKEK